MFKTIIAATDGSDHGTRAVKLAAGLARLSKAKLILVHVRPPYGTIPMLQQAIAAKKRLPAKVNNETGRLSALSRCRTKDARSLGLAYFQATATAARHVFIAAARKPRCVWADVRWRWTLKML